jgi:hypothetical protein
LITSHVGPNGGDGDFTLSVYAAKHVVVAPRETVSGTVARDLVNIGTLSLFIPGRYELLIGEQRRGSSQSTASLAACAYSGLGYWCDSWPLMLVGPRRRKLRKQNFKGKNTAYADRQT